MIAGKLLKLYILKDIGLWPFAFAIIVIAKYLGFQFWPADSVSYVADIIVFLIFISKTKRVDFLSLAFLLYLPITILYNNPPPVFNSWMRLVLFVLVFGVSSPLFQGLVIDRIRSKVFNVMVWSCAITGVLSFFCYFIGINMMKKTEFSISENSGTFSGITNHSMTLGAIAACGVTFLVCKAFTTKNNKYWYASIPCMGAVLFSSSRGALLSAITGILVVSYIFSKRTSVFLKRILVITFLLAVTYPLWKGAMVGVERKQSNNIQMGGTFSSREAVWDDRIDEFRSSPIVGIGFCVVDMKSESFGINGSIEPSSSWLAVLSMSGIIGFFFVLCLFVRAFRNIRHSRGPDQPFLYGLLISYILHLLYEGFIYAGGSFECFQFWITLTCITNYKSVSNDSSK